MFANYDQNAILVLMVLNLANAVDAPRVWLHENTVSSLNEKPETLPMITVFCSMCG